MGEKVFKTYDEQIEILRNRGISMDTEDDRQKAKGHLNQQVTL